MNVLKFGGTSVGSAPRIKEVAQLISDEQPKIVVLSAMSGTTNTLVDITNNLYRNDRQEALTAIQNLELDYLANSTTRKITSTRDRNSCKPSSPISVPLLIKTFIPCKRKPSWHREKSFPPPSCTTTCKNKASPRHYSPPSTSCVSTRIASRIISTSNKT